ncbi:MULTISPECIES: SDR family oxidoreductase [Gammaproteobacteria]|uniref:SDR family oxidoreductase n=1 Tax=Gammaproteobacteria TaxID=1236 RepID=UPI000DCF70F8|nr:MULTISPECIES: SDR family oxidoreductase [Gammaproteobacteria]RTE85939.1 SDR family oxidoreductase [Aliidiomarina sp. B3213]TCZ90062.1 SDR family oxidoreductase [Lysobacter sp. N42]
MRVVITGAAGYIGSQLAKKLIHLGVNVLGLDIVSKPASEMGFDIEKMDIRDPNLGERLREFGTTHVVHLASIVSPGANEELEYDIDVNGTRNVVEGCLFAGVKHLTVTSSGAAYGYHADNPAWLKETDTLRGNDAFSYSRHKRIVEEMLAQYREGHPTLQQLILRPGTVLGDTTKNMITQLFARKSVLAIRGYDSPFVFIWDKDLIEILTRGVSESITGIYNVAGDGAVTVKELAGIMRKPLRQLPAGLVRSVLWVTHSLGLSQAGPNHLLFLQFRPVLDNARLKSEFGYQPEKSSVEVFKYFLKHQKS